MLGLGEALLRRAIVVAAEHRLHTAPHRSEMAVQTRIRTPGELAFGEEGGQRVGLLCQRSQDIKGGHVAGSLPDAGERRVAQQEGQAGVLDIAVAAEALQRLGGVRRGALADVVLHDRGGEAAEGRLVAVVALGDAQRGHGRRLGLERPDRRARWPWPAGRRAARRTPSDAARDGPPRRPPGASRRPTRAGSPAECG